MRNQEPTEHQEQVALIEWARLRRATIPELGMLFSIANGSDRHPAVGAKLKKEGVAKGVPDLCLPVPRGGYHGLYVELKRQRGGRVSPEQKAWIESLNSQGYRATVCYGATDAIKVIESYMGG